MEVCGTADTGVALDAVAPGKKNKQKKNINCSSYIGLKVAICVATTEAVLTRTCSLQNFKSCSYVCLEIASLFPSCCTCNASFPGLCACSTKKWDFHLHIGEPGNFALIFLITSLWHSHAGSPFLVAGVA